MRLPSLPHIWLTVSRRQPPGPWLPRHLFSIYRWAKSPPMRKVVMHVTSSLIGLNLMLPYVERALRFSLGWLLLGTYGYVSICFVGCLWTSSFVWNMIIITIWPHIYEVYRPHKHELERFWIWFSCIHMQSFICLMDSCFHVCYKWNNKRD